MKPTDKILSIQEAARLGKRDAFFQNVKREIIPKLIARGKLNGTAAGVKSSVKDDATFRHLMAFGIESFVYNKQGWSFTAIHADIERVANALKDRPGVLAYSENIQPMKLGRDGQVSPESDKRHVFLVKIRQSNWSVLLQTVHWIQQCDMLIGMLFAADLSQALKTSAVTAWDDDFSGSTLVVCENGRKTKVLTTDEDWGEYYAYYYEQEIALPECFISTRGSDATLMVADVSAIERADHAVIGIPTDAQSTGPHVFYKLGAFAAALSSGVEDEAEFASHAVDGLWRQVESIRKGHS